eukprot:scaffold1178_cov252-Pinguiococcus_pyrenoidosus.AAC.16
MGRLCVLCSRWGGPSAAAAPLPSVPSRELSPKNRMVNQGPGDALMAFGCLSDMVFRIMRLACTDKGRRPEFLQVEAPRGSGHGTPGQARNRSAPWHSKLRRLRLPTSTLDTALHCTPTRNPLERPAANPHTKRDTWRR